MTSLSEKDVVNPIDSEHKSECDSCSDSDYYVISSQGKVCQSDNDMIDQEERVLEDSMNSFYHVDGNEIVEHSDNDEKKDDRQSENSTTDLSVGNNSSNCTVISYHGEENVETLVQCVDPNKNVCDVAKNKEADDASTVTLNNCESRPNVEQRDDHIEVVKKKVTQDENKITIASNARHSTTKREVIQNLPLRENGAAIQDLGQSEQAGKETGINNVADANNSGIMKVLQSSREMIMMFMAFLVVALALWWQIYINRELFCQAIIKNNGPLRTKNNDNDKPPELEDDQGIQFDSFLQSHLQMEIHATNRYWTCLRKEVNSNSIDKCELDLRDLYDETFVRSSYSKSTQRWIAKIEEQLNDMRVTAKNLIGNNYKDKSTERNEQKTDTKTLYDNAVEKGKSAKDWVMATSKKHGTWIKDNTKQRTAWAIKKISKLKHWFKKKLKKL